MEFIPLLIKEIRDETDEYRSIIFIKPKNFSFELGECFSLRFPGDDDSKVFSFASSPTEEYIIISYKKGISPFKKRLEALLAGDALEVALYGSQFQFDSQKPSVFIAGGIGITAFRSILKYCIDKNISTPIHLLFSNRTTDFPFKKEFDTFIKLLPQLTITYISTDSEGRLTTEKIKKLLPRFDNETYIAGPPLMIDTIIGLLTANGMHEDMIHTESFDGYTDDI